MRKTVRNASFLVCGVLTGAAALYAAGRPGDGHTPPTGIHQLMLRLHGGANEPCDLAASIHAHFDEVHAALELTDAQKQAIHAAFSERRADFVNALRPVVEAHRALINAVHADTTDEAAIRAAAERVGTSLAEAAVVIARIKTETLRAAALTPEQTRKLGEMKDHMDAAIGRFLDMLQPAAENPGR